MQPMTPQHKITLTYRQYFLFDYFETVTANFSFPLDVLMVEFLQDFINHKRAEAEKR